MLPLLTLAYHGFMIHKHITDSEGVFMYVHTIIQS